MQYTGEMSSIDIYECYDITLMIIHRINGCASGSCHNNYSTWINNVFLLECLQLQNTGEMRNIDIYECYHITLIILLSSWCHNIYTCIYNEMSQVITLQFVYFCCWKLDSSWYF